MAKITLGVLAMVVGFGLLIVTAVAIVDPAGTQMADDGNPFGPTTKIWRRDLTSTLVSLGLVVVGAASVASGARDQRSTSDDAG